MGLLRVLRRASHLILHRDNLGRTLVSSDGCHLTILDLLLQGHDLLQVLLFEVHLLDYIVLRRVRAIVSLRQRARWLLTRINVNLGVDLFLLRSWLVFDFQHVLLTHLLHVELSEVHRRRL